MGLVIFFVIIALGLALYDYFDTRDWQLLTSANRNNVVFEQRNKKYGAYTLRRDYNDLMITVIVGMLVFVGVISAVNFGLNSGPPAVVVVPDLDTIQMQLPSPPMEEVQAPPSPIKIASGGGSGTPDNSRVDQTPDPMNRAHDPLSTLISDKKEGQGNRDDRENPNNTASTRVPSPFSGSGGKGGGDNGGIGTGPGRDIGPGSSDGPPGSGKGSGTPQRKLEHGVDVSSIKSDEQCTVVLTLRVNPAGEVVNCTVVQGSTTTSNAEIIRQVRSLVMSQVRYSKKQGTGNDVITMKINVSAS